MDSTYSILMITVIASVLVLITVILHYEVLSFFSQALAKLRWVGRARIAVLILGLLFVHIIEIWIFGVGIMFAELHGGIGFLKGEHSQELLDFVYYSAMTYTTVGCGDIFPMGSLRFIAAMESLTGLMLITWSASFTFLEMHRFWRDR